MLCAGIYRYWARCCSSTAACVLVASSVVVSLLLLLQLNRTRQMPPRLCLPFLNVVQLVVVMVMFAEVGRKVLSWTRRKTTQKEARELQSMDRNKKKKEKMQQQQLSWKRGNITFSSWVKEWEIKRKARGKKLKKRKRKKEDKFAALSVLGFGKKQKSA